MTHDIRKLITGIREWEAADKAYKEARKTLTGGAWVNKQTIEACAYLDECSMAINGKFHEARTLAAFVALADAYEAQAARIERAMRIEGYYPEEYEIGEGERMANDMRDEFRAALTGNDEGEA